jgi:hypothetical protein
VGDGFDAVKDRSGEQERQDRERGDGDQQDVDGACEVLTTAAVGAVGEVLIIICPHGGREARDIVSPPGKDISDQGIGAMRDGYAAGSGGA